jgi:hypothetical protein
MTDAARTRRAACACVTCVARTSRRAGLAGAAGQTSDASIACDTRHAPRAGMASAAGLTSRARLTCRPCRPSWSAAGCAGLSIERRLSSASRQDGRASNDGAGENVSKSGNHHPTKDSSSQKRFSAGRSTSVRQPENACATHRHANRERRAPPELSLLAAIAKSGSGGAGAGSVNHAK